MRHVRGIAVRIALLCFTACDPIRLAPGASDLEAEPSSISFGRTPVGTERKLPVTLQNRGKADVTLQLTVARPFGVVPAIEVPGGGAVAVEVSFAPERIGIFSADLEITGAGDVERVALSGESSEPAVCPATACTASRFDPDTHGCVAESMPDGTPCAEICVESGACHQGRCVGTFNRCDDGDPCTVDSCGDQGCLHVASTFCSENPCAAAPDETPCPSLSVCQGEGVCRNHKCVLPAPGRIPVEWDLRTAGYIDTVLVLESGEAFFLGSKPGDTRAIRLSSAGQKTLDVSVGTQPVRLLGVEGDAFFVLEGLNTLTARSLATGQMIWTTDLTGWTPTSYTPGPEIFLIRADSKDLFLTAQAGRSGSTTVILDRVSGKPLAHVPAGYVWTHAALASGITATTNAWSSGAGPLSGEALFFGSSGTLMFQTPGLILAATRDRVLTGDYCGILGRNARWLDAQSGAPLEDWGYVLDKIVADDTYGVAIVATARECLRGTDEVRLEGRFFGAGVGAWSLPLPTEVDPSLTELILLDSRNVLFLRKSSTDVQLQEISPTGEILMSCELENASSVGSANTVLADGILYYDTFAYRLPGRRIAPHGWVRTRGGQRGMSAEQ